MSNEPEIVTLPGLPNAQPLMPARSSSPARTAANTTPSTPPNGAFAASVVNDAGVGTDDAGIIGLPYLDQIGLPAATASADSCHIGDGDHTLAHGIISHVDQALRLSAAAPTDRPRLCGAHAQRPDPDPKPPPITEGTRVTLRDAPGEPKLICADSVGMIRPEDTGQIVITASHAALPGGRPDTLIPPGIYAVFFSDAGVGMDGAGIARLPVLNAMNVIAGTTSAASARLAIPGALSARDIAHVTSPATQAGASVGMPFKTFVGRLLATARAA